MKQGFGDRKTNEGREASGKPVSWAKLADKPRQLLKQVEERLLSGNVGERIEARGILLNMVLKGGPDKATELLCSNCRKAITSEAIEERRHTRNVLGQLAYKKDSREARSMLEGSYRQAIEDFDLNALVFLGMNAREGVGREVDAALEVNYERIAKEMRLDTLEYMAAMSNCSIAVRRRAAGIVADCEQRKGNLAFVHDATEDCEIKNLMAQALRRREG